jgi:hypothetical protein
MLKNPYDIILTDKFPDRILRHLLFWLGQFVFWAFMVSGFFFDAGTIEFLKSDLRLHTYFIPDIIFTYIVSYYLVDELLAKNKFLKFSIAIIFLTLITYVTFLLLRFNDYDMFGAPRETRLHLMWMYSMKFISLGPPVTCAMFLSLKFLKNYHKKTEENKVLISENNQSQLSLLKAQIHPHFLFNTLSNIHSFMLTKSPIASELVSRLSATLKYMIFDCEAPLVSLEKELTMIKDYTELERVRYSKSLTMHVEIKGDASNKQIAPLFLIPLIENAFKHGTSQVLSNPWIHLKLAITDSFLFMDLRNSKPIGIVAGNHKSGIGLANVKKRLQLIYPHEHSLVVKSDDASFIIQIKIPLVTLKEAIPTSTQKMPSPSVKTSVAESVI